ncbi:MAG: DUF4833 domain-containing protein [Saprospiraceae bacterium]|nr:DUF4833 domain-containing protein [Saprospiraceae bacterium]
MFYTQSEHYDTIVKGHAGRPAGYPDLDFYPNLLFYIQRNQNINTVVYEANILSDNLVNLNDPINIKWIKFGKNGEQEIQSLNYIQRKLAYGYHFKIINHDLIEFCFVSYENMKFFLSKDKKNNFRVSTVINEVMSLVDRIYIYAEDLGIFPQVKFAEFFGRNMLTNEKVYKKLFFH